MIKNPPSNSRVTSSICGPEDLTKPGAYLLSPDAANTEAGCLEPAPQNKRSHLIPEALTPKWRAAPVAYSHPVLVGGGQSTPKILTFFGADESHTVCVNI